MNSANPPKVASCYSEKDFDGLGFHDCRINQISWSADNYSIVFRLDYIVEWVKPEREGESFRFWISPAELRFRNADDVSVNLYWLGMRLDCVIDDMDRLESRRTPNGTEEVRWQFNLLNPEGNITLWATVFDLVLLSPPALSDSQLLS